MIDLNSRIDDNDPCWLVKVDTRILGPMSFNEVLSKLTSGELYSHNEVMAPLDRWRTLQSHPLFAAAVEKLRRQSDTVSEHGMTRSERTSFTRTLDINFENMTPTPMGDALTPTPAPSFATPAPQQQISSTVASPLPIVTPPVFRPDEKKMFTVRFVLGISGLIIAAIVSVLLFSKKSKPINTSVDTQQTSMVGFFDKGFYHKKRGEWSEAIKYFKQAHSINMKDHITVFELAPLLVQFENQYIIARNILDKVGSGVRFNPEDVCVARNAAGLSYSYEGQQDKQSYNKAINKYQDCLSQLGDEVTPTENVFFTQLNKSFALMMLGKYPVADSILSSTKGSMGQSMAPYLFMLENYLHDGYYKNNRTAFEKAYNLSTQISSRPIYDGQQEVLLFQAYAAYKLNKEVSVVAEALEKALNIDPDLTTDHYHSPNMDWRVFNWKHFDFICKDFKNFSRQDLVSWLEFTCAYKINGEIGADQVVGDLRNKSQDKSIAQVADAIWSYRYGQMERAKDALSTKLVKNPNKLYYQILIKICIQLKDEACLEKSAAQVVRTSPLHSTLARMHFGSDLSREQAVQKGLGESKNYLPFVRASKK